LGDENVASRIDWNVTRLSGSLGAEVTGVDLGGVTSDDIDEIKLFNHDSCRKMTPMLSFTINICRLCWVNVLRRN